MSQTAHKLLPHGDIEAHGPDLWSVSGSLPIPLKRRMVIFRLKDGTLLLHSVIAMDDAGMAKLEALGKPSIMIVPHGAHRMDAPFYKRRYPDLRVICPAETRKKVEEVVPVDATCEDTLPALGIGLHPMTGFKHGEIVFELPAAGGKALLASDVVANRDHPPGIGGWLTANITGGVTGRLGVPRIMKWMLVKNKAAARASLAKLADLGDVAIVLPGHGLPVVGGCSDALREAVANF